MGSKGRFYKRGQTCGFQSNREFLDQLSYCEHLQEDNASYNKVASYEKIINKICNYVTGILLKNELLPMISFYGHTSGIYHQ
jgi:hypothetical protein